MCAHALTLYLLLLLWRICTNMQRNVAADAYAEYRCVRTHLRRTVRANRPLSSCIMTSLVVHCCACRHHSQHTAAGLPAHWLRCANMIEHRATISFKYFIRRQRRASKSERIGLLISYSRNIGNSTQQSGALMHIMHKFCCWCVI